MNGSQVASIQVLVSQIDKLLERKDTIPQATKDELILVVSKMLLLTLDEHSKRLTFLEKYKPWLQALAWAMAIIAGSLLTMAISGHLSVSIIP